VSISVALLYAAQTEASAVTTRGLVCCVELFATVDPVTEATDMLPGLLPTHGPVEAEPSGIPSEYTHVPTGEGAEDLGSAAATPWLALSSVLTDSRSLVSTGSQSGLDDAARLFDDMWTNALPPIASLASASSRPGSEASLQDTACNELLFGTTVVHATLVQLKGKPAIIFAFGVRRAICVRPEDSPRSSGSRRRVLNARAFTLEC
jgi:hypothetical protein